MKIIGLVGGVASGKSLVAGMLIELGAVHLDADRTGHVVLAEDADVRHALIGRWGDSILAPSGEIDRPAIARKVFGTNPTASAERHFLEGLLHPRIRERLNKIRDEAVAAGKPAIILDAPLLLEADWGSLCDIILMIEAPHELRLKRALTRGWTESEFHEREAAQWPPEEKRRHADAVIPNNGTQYDLRRAVQEFWNNYIAPAIAS